MAVMGEQSSRKGSDLLFRAFRRAKASSNLKLLLAGIMPIRNVKQIKRISNMCGASLPNTLLTKIAAVEDDNVAVEQIGVHHAMRQCERLLEDKVPGIHFYTMNRSTATRAIFQEIKGLL